MKSDFRFDEIEGLRGYLALWVAFGHAWQLTHVPVGPAGYFLAVPSNAVTVFIIVSGFVITHLLVEKREPYLRYITRRFFRLWPLFAVCLAAGWLTAPLMLDVVHAMPWAGEPFWRDILASRDLRAGELAENPLAHIFAHLTLLHGIVPEELLPEASRTILGPAWSISLEWQFYLIAPAILALAVRPAGFAILAAVTLAAYVLSQKGLFGTHDAAFLPNSGLYFIIGIGSRLALPRLRALDADPLAVAAVVGAAILLTANKPLGLLPWVLVYPFVVWPGEGLASKAVRLALISPAPLAVGRASYSLYLAHYPILIAVAWLVLRAAPGVSPVAMFGALIGAIAFAVLVSLLLYRFVEVPGIALGRLVAKGLPALRPA